MKQVTALTWKCKSSTIWDEHTKHSTRNKLQQFFTNQIEIAAGLGLPRDYPQSQREAKERVPLLERPVTSTVWVFKDLLSYGRSKPSARAAAEMVFPRHFSSLNPTMMLRLTFACRLTKKV